MTIWTKIALLYVLVFAAQHTAAQDRPIINEYEDKPVRPRPGYEDSLHHADSTRIHYGFTGTGVIDDANDIRSYILTSALKGSVVTKDMAFNLNNSWVYGKQAGTLTNNDFSSTFDVGLYKTLRHFYYWGLAGYTTSYSLQIIHLEQAGLGIGYNVLDKKKAVIILSDGPLYEAGDLYDSLYTTGGSVYQRDRYQTIRNSFRILCHWVVHNIFIFDCTWYFQSAYEQTSDYIMRLNAGVSIKLDKWLSFTTTYQYNKFTRTNSENALFNVGLTVAR